MAPDAAESVYAALDLGTNNCRLLIANPVFKETRQGRSLKALDSFSRIVRLGEGVSSTGLLSDAAIERTIAALKTCRRKLDRHHVAMQRCVATEACRRARNSKYFLDIVTSETDINLEIIQAQEEAELALLGCCSLLKPMMQKALAFDIGGGSTELMWVATPEEYHAKSPPAFPFKPQLLGWMSLPLGVMNLSERFGNSPYTEIYFEDIVVEIQRELHEFDAIHHISECTEDHSVQLLSTSGTVTTLAAIHMHLQRYDRSRIDGMHIRTEELQESVQELLAMRPSERFMHPCVGPERSDYILAGCAIFEALIRTFPFSHITIADRGVREGIVISHMLEAADG
jgi:exopolyphosphatase/guanosine-5'-triphosphate,3'-diphosphate pyrophosphatase